MDKEKDMKELTEKEMEQVRGGSPTGTSCMNCQYSNPRDCPIYQRTNLCPGKIESPASGTKVDQAPKVYQRKSKLTEEELEKVNVGTTHGLVAYLAEIRSEVENK